MKKHKMKISKFEVRLEEEAGGGYNVTVPVFPDIKAHGKTLKEAKALAKKAVELRIDALKANEDTTVNVGRLQDEIRAYMERNSQIGGP